MRITKSILNHGLFFKAPLLHSILCCGMTAKVGFKSRPAFKFTGGVLFDRQNRTFRQEFDTEGDAAAQSRFDVSETAGTNDNHVYIVLLGALDNCACDRAFPHFSHDIVNALLARPFLRIYNQFSGNHFQSIQVYPRDLFQFGVCTRFC